RARPARPSPPPAPPRRLRPPRRGAAPRAASPPRPPPLRSSLDRALRQPADDEPLQEREERDRGDGRDEHAGRERPPVLAVLLVDVAAHPDRERELRAGREQDARDDELVDG